MKRLLASFLVFCAASTCFAAQAPKGLFTAPLLALDEIQAANLKLEIAEDGTRYIAMRMRVEGASAVRVYISDMRLGAGQSLFVSNAAGTEVHGPFESGGPTQSGEFWSPAVSGSEIILELHTGPEGAADLPFAIESIEAADAPSMAPDAVEQTTETVQSIYRGGVVTHQVVDGMAIYEGDIVLGAANELPRARADSKDRDRSAVGITGTSYRWPKAKLPYVIAAGIPNQARITSAIAHWNTKLAGVVEIVPRTNETAYVNFVRPASASSCSSYIGKTFNGSNPINVGDYCSTGNIIHEIGHAWGLWHEHTREDRDTYVTVNMANIQDGLSHNFTQNISNGDDIGAYDFGSIMHYNATAFSKNGLPTIVTIPAGVPIGQRSALSTGDIAGIRVLYPPTGTPPPATVTITLTSNPSGATVAVDGVNYTTPVAFTWTVGSVHTIAGVNSTTSTVRTTFVSWSDGGAQSHSITASSTVTTFKVDYAVAYPVKAAAVPVGSATTTPASADTYYANGTSVGLSAIAPAGYCFSGWTGLVAGTPAQTSVVATKAYNLQANFQAAAVTLTSSTLASPASGGAYSTDVTVNSGCMWTATSTVPWIKITSAASGSGSGTVSFTVDPNASATTRTGAISVEGQLLSVVQSAPVVLPLAAAASASFVRADLATVGSWKGVYGSEGFILPNDSVSYPPYVTVTPATASPWTWAASTQDVRGLHSGIPGATNRIATCWYASRSFSFNLAFNDLNTHQVALYLIDWDQTYNRAERIDIVDSNGVVLDSRSLAGFSGGQYLVWNLTGNVTIRITNTKSSANAVLSGIFFGNAPPPVVVPTSSATFLRTDTTTMGSWKGVYGADGFLLPNDGASYPPYVTVTQAATNLWTWSASTSDVRAPQKSAATAFDRLATCWYSATSFIFNLTFNDQDRHQVALYLLDWDRIYNRSQTIEILDANGVVLDSRTVAGFSGGQYLVWNVSGSVKIRVTNTNPTNAVVSGLFFR